MTIKVTRESEGINILSHELTMQDSFMNANQDTEAKSPCVMKSAYAQ